ncbi:RING-H2 finger protein [Quillaja saponaria]|uniref:RING-type E3 ubiquitin transferase n=1 Tax=Quillaja saponaria TaxID=32244 RepID=A0AAD7QHJ3_QUISA|nr:RING-H2 finger protein [Quillaja saponaria]KAJ7981554.1 RING-H2 finger protein [Quillaja saponaria]
MSSFDDDHNDDTPLFLRNKFHNDFNGKIMLTAIISLSLVVIIVIALHLYARYVLRRQARRRSAMRQLGLTVALARSNEPPKTGLDPTIIAALPKFVFKRQNSNNSQDGGIECAVCLNVLEDEERARKLPNCKHIFHVDCIDKWLSSHSTCPICRTEAEPRFEPEPREGPHGPVAQPPTAPPVEGTSEGDGRIPQSAAKISGSNSSSRLSSFRRILSREISSRRIQRSSREDVNIEDLERQ